MYEWRLTVSLGKRSAIWGIFKRLRRDFLRHRPLCRRQIPPGRDPRRLHHRPGRDPRRGPYPEADDGDGTTSVRCTVCSGIAVAGEAAHDFSEGPTCGNDNCTAHVATSVTMGETVAYYTALDAAIRAAADCTADDEAVVTSLDDIDLGSSTQNIYSGVFIIDLNGRTINGGTFNGQYAGLRI